MKHASLYIKPLWLVVLVCLQVTFSNLVAQDKSVYPEPHLYRQTLNQESVKRYQQALSVYKNTPQEVIHYSSHKKFCEQYHQLFNLPDSTAEQLNYNPKLAAAIINNPQSFKNKIFGDFVVTP